MLKLLAKEMKLAASPLSYLFIAFGLMAFLPGYPILVGTFFACLGLFQSFQCTRENNDIAYTTLLPVAKGDIVWAKFLFCLLIEACFLVVTSVPVVLRMTVLSAAPVYRSNVLMNANLVYLGFALVILGLFNRIFVGGFFKTAYRFGKPFVAFLIAAFLVVGVGETLIHIPLFSALNAFGFEHIGLQTGVLAAGLAVFALLTACAVHRSVNRFERIDL